MMADEILGKMSAAQIRERERGFERQVSYFCKRIMQDMMSLVEEQQRRFQEVIYLFSSILTYD
jgi:hypothetical protein